MFGVMFMEWCLLIILCFVFVVFVFIFYINQFSGPSGSQIRYKYFVNKFKVSLLTSVYFNKPRTWLLKL